MKFNRIYIEITNKCNLRCSFCTAGSRIPRQMSTEEFSSVLHRIRPFTDYIYLHVQGEPLLHSSLEEILSVCDQAGIQVQIVTNGTLSERFRMLDHPSVRKVSFSVQSIEFHHECNPSVYMENILSFCRRASAAGRPYCEIRFWRSDQFTSDRTVQAYEYVLSRYPLQDTKRKNSFRLMDHVFLSIDNSFDWPDLNHDEVAARGYCIGSLKQLAVLSDGTVVPCCLDAEGAVSFGNLFRDDMAMILSSERYRKMTENMKNRILSEELCRKCTYRKRFDQ